MSQSAQVYFGWWVKILLEQKQFQVDAAKAQR